MFRIIELIVFYLFVFPGFFIWVTFFEDETWD